MCSLGRLHAVTVAGIYHVVQLGWTTNVSFGEKEKDSAWVARINGRKLGLTPMKSLLVPPPMSAFYVTVGEAVEEVGLVANIFF